MLDQKRKAVEMLKNKIGKEQWLSGRVLDSGRGAALSLRKTYPLLSAGLTQEKSQHD